MVFQASIIFSYPSCFEARGVGSIQISFGPHSARFEQC
jgi:hypothetical protein